MPVNKRLRYRILRRDNFTCRYCGTVAPDVHLEVDHVQPRSLGGCDEPWNLVTACVDCNRGKSAMKAGEPLLAGPSEESIAGVRAARDVIDLLWGALPQRIDLEHVRTGLANRFMERHGEDGEAPAYALWPIELKAFAQSVIEVCDRLPVEAWRSR